MKPLSRYADLAKQKLKVVAKEIEEEVVTDRDTLHNKIKQRLDINQDGQLSKADMIEFILDFVDADGDGKVSIWEYIALFMEIRKIIKMIK